MKPARWFVALLLALAVVLGWFRLQFDVEVLHLLPADEPVVHGLKLYQRYFSNARELIITVKAADPERTEHAAEVLAKTFRARPDLASSVTWRPAWSEKPEEAAELVGYLWLNQPPSVFAQLGERLSGTNVIGLIEDAREQLATSMSPIDMARRGYDPFNLLALPRDVTAGADSNFGEGQDLFVSSDGTFRILFIQAKPELASYRNCRAWLERVKAAVQKSRHQEGIANEVVVSYTGAPAFVTEIAGGMEFDTTVSVGLTSVIITILFWLAHRRAAPVLWLLVLLALILACTMALGGLVFGAVNVVSLGFAAILLGLAVDYAVVHYQEAIASPTATIPEIRRAIGPSIFWAAATTISAFLVLNLGGLPGLAQLGTLVALGVSVSAFVMIYAFLPPLFPERRIRAGQALNALPGASDHSIVRPKSFTPPPLSPAVGPSRARALMITSVLLAGGAGLLAFGLPSVDRTADALRPRHSQAHAALEEVKSRLAQGRDPLWVITQGADEIEMGQRLDRLAGMLNPFLSNQVLTALTLPNALWPRPAHQQTNRMMAAKILSEREDLFRAAFARGFSSNSLRVAETIFNTWRRAQGSTNVFWPTNATSQWILDKMLASTPAGYLAVGFIYPAQSEGSRTAFAALGHRLTSEGYILSGWELLGPAILDRVQQRLWWMLAPMLALVALTLWLAFRHWIEILLSVAVLVVSGISLLAIMKASGWSWNLLNLMALPLMLGTGVDYSIFTLLALRRHGGDRQAAYNSVGRALLLCGGTAMAGFGSLALSTNAGMASLGLICAVAIGLNMFISVYLLPAWWECWSSSRRNKMSRSIL